MANMTLKQKVERKIDRCPDRCVFMRKDFAKMGGYDQVGRALLQLTSENKLVRMGYGLYARARINSLSGEPMIDCDGGFIGAAREALDLLGVEWDISEAERLYNENLTTQVPMHSGVIIKERFNRKIETEDGFKLRVA